MKIWIDGRICDENTLYARFCEELIEAFVAENSEHEIIVYRKSNLNLSKNKYIDNLTAAKIFNKEHFAFMIFFDYCIPSKFTGEYTIVLEWLKEIFFPKKQWIHRKIHSYKLTRAIEKSKNIIALDGGTALELNERLNVAENKIRKIHGFFPIYETVSKPVVHADIKTKHNLRGEYLIYDSGNEIHNNFERILKTIKKLKDSWVIVYIIILCDATTKDLDIRGKVIEYDIANQILFLGQVSKDIEHLYYEQSLWVIFSSIYESFPFQFVKAIAYNCHIFANDIPANRQIMWDSISYLDPLSIHNMRDIIHEHINNTKVTDYGTALKWYSPYSSALELSEILETKK